jgi:rhodanese-related sulfurtransferase
MFNLFGLLSSSVPLQPKSRVYDLKARLDWGEPALTIIDARTWEQFSQRHIVGAVLMPIADLAERARRSLELDRDIYIYADTDEETAEAAEVLRAAGYRNVSELRGGVAAWKAVGFPIESFATSVAR